MNQSQAEGLDPPYSRHVGQRATFLLGAALLPLAALAVTGCGSSRSVSTASSKGARRPTVEVARTKVGKILVDSNGRTLYLFDQDKGTSTTCFSSCARAWPPLRTKSKPTAGGEGKTSLLGTTMRPDGAPQVTYNGHPLYLYQNDLRRGDVTGQGIDVWGDVWWVVSPSGKRITKGGRKPPGYGY